MTSHEEEFISERMSPQELALAFVPDFEAGEEVALFAENKDYLAIAEAADDALNHGGINALSTFDVAASRLVALEFAQRLQSGVTMLKELANGSVPAGSPVEPGDYMKQIAGFRYVNDKNAKALQSGPTIAEEMIRKADRVELLRDEFASGNPSLAAEQAVLTINHGAGALVLPYTELAARESSGGLVNLQKRLGEIERNNDATLHPAHRRGMAYDTVNEGLDHIGQEAEELVTSISSLLFGDDF